MIDELDLAWEDDDRGRSRHRRARGGGPARGRRPKKRRGRSFVALFFTLVLLGGLAFGGWYGFGRIRDYFAIKDYTGDGTGTVTVQIAEGDQGADMANKLYQADVVKSAKAFVAAFEANPESKKIEVGYYKLRHQMKASKALDMLLARNADGTLINRVSSRITITEGMISTDVFAALSKATNIPAQDFANLAKDPVALGVPDFWFTRGDGKEAQKSIEGFLYPATYDFDPGATATTIMKKIVGNFNAEMAKLDFPNQAQNNLHLSPYEVLVAASIAQVEGVFPEDMPGIARVLYNRAYSGSFPCSCLGLDSTVNYWLRVTGKEAKDSGSLTNAQMHDPNNPYNTYDKPGLPIGPISNPGAEALKGAMTAPKNNFFYFLAIDKAGHTAFAATYADFCKKTHEAKANGVSIGVC
jgi:peptidoglycan lytic transglycosylase G